MSMGTAASRHVVHSIPFTTRLASKNGAHGLLAHDRARAQKLISATSHPHGPKGFRLARSHHHPHGGNTGPTGGGSTTSPPSSGTGASVDVTDAGVTYTMDVGVGSPPQQFTLLIDTGSSNTWVGAAARYVPTSTSQNTKKAVNVSYGSGKFSGTEYIDEVTLGPGLVIKDQSIGVASTATGFNGVDGILGIGPVDLTSTTVAGTSSVPTVTDNLFKQGTISNESIGISYVPSTEASAANGELTFGATDSSKYTGEITYAPITTTSPASNYWGIDQTVTYGANGVTLLNNSAGIVDTGTTLLLVSTPAFKAYEKATGAVLDSTTGLLSITEAQYEKLESLFFNIAGTTFEFTANAQIWPRALNSTLGAEEGKIYLIVADMGVEDGSGLDFINGFGFLQRFYSIYDTTGSRVGLAPTKYTDATTN